MSSFDLVLLVDAYFVYALVGVGIIVYTYFVYARVGIIVYATGAGAGTGAGFLVVYALARGARRNVALGLTRGARRIGARVCFHWVGAAFWLKFLKHAITILAMYRFFLTKSQAEGLEKAKLERLRKMAQAANLRERRRRVEAMLEEREIFLKKEKEKFAKMKETHRLTKIYTFVKGAVGGGQEEFKRKIESPILEVTDRNKEARELLFKSAFDLPLMEN